MLGRRRCAEQAAVHGGPESEVVDVGIAHPCAASVVPPFALLGAVHGPLSRRGFAACLVSRPWPSMARRPTATATRTTVRRPACPRRIHAPGRSAPRRSGRGVSPPRPLVRRAGTSPPQASGYCRRSPLAFRPLALLSWAPSFFDRYLHFAEYGLASLAEFLPSGLLASRIHAGQPAARSGGVRFAAGVGAPFAAADKPPHFRFPPFPPRPLPPRKAGGAGGAPGARAAASTASASPLNQTQERTAMNDDDNYRSLLFLFAHQPARAADGGANRPRAAPCHELPPNTTQRPFNRPTSTRARPYTECSFTTEHPSVDKPGINGGYLLYNMYVEC